MKKAEVSETVLNLKYSTVLRVGKHDIKLVTENMPYDSKAPKLKSFISRGYQKDKIVYAARKDFTDDIDIMDASQLQLIIKRIHREALEEVKAGKGLKKDPRLYLKAIKLQIASKMPLKALAIAKEALEMHPDDPMILTYYGYLSAMVEKKFKTGIDACERAIRLLPRKLPVGLDSSTKPLLYLHLSHVYQASGDRKNAIETIYRGIGFEGEDGPLNKYLLKLGGRRKPVFTFLRRANWINRLVGRIRHRVMGPPKPQEMKQY